MQLCCFSFVILLAWLMFRLYTYGHGRAQLVNNPTYWEGSFCSIYLLDA